jgi:ATP-dependent exoDNAse (exonuclease V) beta subunit
MPELQLLPAVPGLFFEEAGHRYMYRSKQFGTLRPDSVSQILTSTGAKTMNYAAWRRSLMVKQNLTEEQADAEMERVRKERAQIGTDFHALAQAYVLGAKEMTLDNQQEAHRMFHRWRQDFGHRIGKVFVVEQPLIHKGAFYVGTPDLVADIDGRLTLVDWKTCREGQHRVRPEWLLQMGAYAAMLKSCYDLSVNHGMNVVIAADRIVIQPWNRMDLVDGWRRFAGFLVEHHARLASFGNEINHAALTALTPLFR